MRFIIILISFSLFLISCGTQQRIVYNYLEDVKDSTGLGSVVMKEPIIQKNDLLNIQVYSSSLDPRIDELYNVRSSSGSTQNSQLIGTLVDQSGNIEHPRVGTIRAEGLTKNQLADVIRSKLVTQLTQPTVIIRFLNFRVTVLGEVGDPGVHSIQTENLTIIEALGLAGDITEYGKKKEVKILRETNGKQELGILDVTSKKMFESPYYQLKQNDKIFVEQTRYRVQRSEQERITQQISFGLTIVTTIALLFSLFK